MRGRSIGGAADGIISEGALNRALAEADWLQQELDALAISKEEFYKYQNDFLAAHRDELAYKPRPSYQVDKKVQTILRLQKIQDVPIIHLRDRLYFVGIYKLPLTIRGDFLVVQVAPNHWERFADYIKKNE